MFDFLPLKVTAALSALNFQFLYEIRLRAEKPIAVNYNGVYSYLGVNGITKNRQNALKVTQKEIEESVFLASGKCVYAVENQIRQGFLTTNAGIRIGLAGDFVYENGNVLSAHTITSLCIRIPHEILGCSQKIIERCLKNTLHSIIILSPPGMGKTTILRDLARFVSNQAKYNVFICDERGELSVGDLGANSDVIRFADKATAFSAGIRAMRPDIIVTDELCPDDYKAVNYAIESGITVFASAHLTDYEAVPHKIFDFYVRLANLGKIQSIEEFSCGSK